jgi:hypothetical protein
MEGLRRKHVESRSLVSGKARGTLARTGAQGLRDAWNSASVGYDRWLSAVGPEMVRVSYLVDLGQDCGCSARE